MYVHKSKVGNCGWKAIDITLSYAISISMLPVMNDKKKEREHRRRNKTREGEEVHMYGVEVVKRSNVITFVSICQFNISLID